MARAYHAKIAPPWPLDMDAFLDVLERVSQVGFVRVTGKGFVAGIIEAHPLSPGWTIAKEVFWFGDADLIRQFRAWAKAHGADEIHYSCTPDNERVRGFYGGFSQLVDVIYSEVPPWV